MKHKDLMLSEIPMQINCLMDIVCMTDNHFQVFPATAELVEWKWSLCQSFMILVVAYIIVINSSTSADVDNRYSNKRKNGAS